MDESVPKSLDRQAYVSLASFRRSGAAVETPVWFARSGDRLVVFTAADSGKVKRLRNNERIRVAPCNARGRVKGDWIEGRARIVDDPVRIESAYAALRRKYGWQLAAVDFFSRLSGRIEQRAILEIEL